MVRWFDTLRAIDRSLELETKHAKLIESLSTRLDEMADRVNRLEAREMVVVAEAKGASGSRSLRRRSATRERPGASFGRGGRASSTT
jgi:hypothetical protein